MEPSRNLGGSLVEPWWNPAGTLVEPLWNPCGTLVEPSWNLTSGPPRTTPEPIWAETAKLSAVAEKRRESLSVPRSLGKRSNADRSFLAGGEDQFVPWVIKLKVEAWLQLPLFQVVEAVTSCWCDRQGMMECPPKKNISPSWFPEKIPSFIPSLPTELPSTSKTQIALDDSKASVCLNPPPHGCKSPFGELPGLPTIFCNPRVV